MFYQLRDAGLELGIPEYQLLLRAFSLGFGVQDEADLRQVCLALWVKTPQQKQLFTFHFNQYMENRRKRLEAEAAARTAAGEAETAGHGESEGGAGAGKTISEPGLAGTEVSGAERMQAARKKLEEYYATIQRRSAARSAGATEPTLTQTSQVGRPATDGTPAAAARPFVPLVTDEVDLAHVLQAALEGPATLEQRYITTGEYYPVTQRQMKQNWRYLRRMVKEGPRTELNVEETVRQVAQQGLIFDLVLEPRRSNRSELILLLDQDGSMAPFHTLARRLVDTAVKGGRLGRTGVFYFHDCPSDYLFSDPYLVDGQTLQHVLSYLHNDQAVLLIFSDAGAARGGLELPRIEQTRQFVNAMRQGVRRLAWLNPLPQARWANTSAAEIARFVPMFELSRRGMDTAIEVLRGRVVAHTVRSR